MQQEERRLKKEDNLFNQQAFEKLKFIKTKPKLNDEQINRLAFAFGWHVSELVHLENKTNAAEVRTMDTDPEKMAEATHVALENFGEIYQFHLIKSKLPKLKEQELKTILNQIVVAMDGADLWQHYIYQAREMGYRHDGNPPGAAKGKFSFVMEYEDWIMGINLKLNRPSKMTEAKHTAIEAAGWQTKSSSPRGRIGVRRDQAQMESVGQRVKIIGKKWFRK